MAANSRYETHATHNFHTLSCSENYFITDNVAVTRHYQIAVKSVICDASKLTNEHMKRQTFFYRHMKYIYIWL